MVIDGKILIWLSDTQYICILLLSTKPTCLLALPLHAVMWSLYIDCSSSAVGHTYAMWQAHLLRGIWHYCEMYVYECLW